MLVHILLWGCCLLITLTPHEFVSKWKRVTALEKQTYQEHFLIYVTWWDTNP